MDDLTSHIEELNSKLTRRSSPGPGSQNMALQNEACNGSIPTSYLISGLENCLSTRRMLPSSSSSSQLAKDSPLIEELSSIAHGQREIMHQLDNLINLLQENRSRQARTTKRCDVDDVDTIRVSLMLTLLFGGLGILLFKGFLPRN